MAILSVAYGVPSPPFLFTEALPAHVIDCSISGHPAPTLMSLLVIGIRAIAQGISIGAAIFLYFRVRDVLVGFFSVGVIMYIHRHLRKKKREKNTSQTGKGRG
jgi:hypothetical protein